MNTFRLRSFDLAWWLMPLVALLLMLGAVGPWAPQAATPAPAPGAGSPKATVPALLPEYSIPGGVENRTETVNRTLFNPTRRPAPVPQHETPKPQMPRGQFALTGTTVVEGKSTAFLREVPGGKSRRVTQGDTVNGMVVAEVKPDRVKLTMGDESEELVLKVVPNSRPTPGAAPAAPPQGMPTPAPGMPAVAQGATPPEQAAMTLAERRRAARAAAQAQVQAQAQGGAAVVPAPGMPQPAPRPEAAARPMPPAPGQSTAPTTWADVFRQYQQRSPNGPAGR